MSQIREIVRESALLRELAAALLFPTFVAWTLLVRILPTDEDLWVFGPSGRGRFLDNTKYAFLHATRNVDKRCVWVSRDLDESTRETLATAGYEAYSGDSWRGRYLTLRADYVFLAYRVDAALKWVVAGSTVVQLWHGTPIKRLNAPDPTWRTAISSRYVRYAYTTWDYFVVTGKGRPAAVFRERFDLDCEQLLVCGYPRNDALVRAVQDEDLGPSCRAADWLDDEDADMVFYLPTYRNGETVSPFDPANFPVEDLATMLAETDAYLLVKPHPRTTIPGRLGDSDRIVVLSGDLDLYPLLRDVDVLLTDYSSVLFDFLLVDRPIVCYAPDAEEYERRRGFSYDLRELPCPVVETPAGLVEALGAALDGNDGYGDDRLRFRDEIFAHVDADSAARVVETVRERTVES